MIQTSTSDASLGCFAGGFCGEIGGEVSGNGEVDVGLEKSQGLDKKYSLVMETRTLVGTVSVETLALHRYPYK